MAALTRERGLLVGGQRSHGDPDAHNHTSQHPSAVASDINCGEADAESPSQPRPRLFSQDAKRGPVAAVPRKTSRQQNFFAGFAGSASPPFYNGRVATRSILTTSRAKSSLGQAFPAHYSRFGQPRRHSQKTRGKAKQAKRGGNDDPGTHVAKASRDPACLRVRRCGGFCWRGAARLGPAGGGRPIRDEIRNRHDE